MTEYAFKVLVNRSPGLLRALGFDCSGLPYCSFQQRWNGQNEPVRRGQIVQARVRDGDSSGCFFLDHIGWKQWQGGYEPLFCDRRHAANLAEGMTLKVRVVSGLRQDHAARVVPCDDKLKLSDPSQAFSDWLARLETHKVEDVGIETAEMFESVWDGMSSTTLPLKGGGAIHIERTRALTAIDVDSTGRIGKGSAGARALSLNTLALKEAARAVCLRDLGGAVVVDCVGPLNEAGRDKLKAVFDAAWKDLSHRDLKINRPSRFGLMEISLPWQATPFGDQTDAGEQALLSLLRTAQTELQHNAGGFYRLHLSKGAYDAYLLRKGLVDTLARDLFHGRLTLSKSTQQQEGLERQ